MVFVKYKEEQEFKLAIENIKNMGEIIKIHPPKVGDVWTKVKVDIEPEK